MTSLLTWKKWTILAYIIVCGILLLLILLVLGLTAWDQVQETSDFPFVDFLTMRRDAVIDLTNTNGASIGSQDNIAAVFARCVSDESGQIIEATRGVRAIPRETALSKASARENPSSDNA